MVLGRRNASPWANDELRILQHRNPYDSYLVQTLVISLQTLGDDPRNVRPSLRNGICLGLCDLDGLVPMVIQQCSFEFITDPRGLELQRDPSSFLTPLSCRMRPG